MNQLSSLALAATLLVTACRDSGDNGDASSVSASTLLDFPTLKLSEYNAETGDLSFPDPLASLDGNQISIAGFMAPYDKLDDMSKFMLMPSYVGCYFCKPPALNQVLYVEQPESARKKPPQFIEEPIKITGTLRLFSPDSEHPAHLAEFVYALDDASIEILSEEELEKAKAIHTKAGQQNPQHDALNKGNSNDDGEAR